MDDFKKLIGQEAVKRAMEVAVAGNFSIGILDVNNSPQLFTNAFLVIGGKKEDIHILPYCYCGNSNNRVKKCNCRPSEIEKFQKLKKFRTLLKSDIKIATTPFRKYANPTGESAINVIKRIKSKGVCKNTKLDGDSTDIINLAVKRLGFNQQDVENVIEIARVVSELDYFNHIKSQHIAEAIQYNYISSLIYDV